ncbi:hypothetical protein G6F42_014618 [Rhizopus arrhizus]|nr:hypothetical protein G6F42_014618 [Rhizopus arrhizus]
MIQDTHCAGCDQAILKQFVEHVNLPNQIWHPECYMIFKFWGAKLAPKKPTDQKDILTIQNQIEKKATRVWTDLSSFEESSANCISDMLLNVAAGAYIEGIRMANQFIMHLEVLFHALDAIKQTPYSDLHCNNEANLICKQMIRFFQLLTTPPNETSITQELLSLVTGLAQNLKSLIRIGLSAALNLERECHVENAIPQFLNQLLELEKKRVWIAGRYWFKDPPAMSDNTINSDYSNICCQCQSTIQDTDYYASSHLQWHPTCFQCSKCTASLNDTNALLLENVLYCQSCCDMDPSVAKCTYVTLLQHNLNQLKAHLSTMSTKSTPVITSNVNGVEKPPNQVLMPETKRQRSILRVLGSRQQQQQKSNRLNSVHLGQIGRTSSTTLRDSASSSIGRKKGGDLMISTDTTNSSSSQQQQQPHLNAALSSPISPVVSPLVASSPSSITKGARFTQSIRRTFSTSSQYSGKRRPSLYNVFQSKKREPRRASVLTIDESGRTSHKYVQLSTLTPSQDYIVRHAAVIAMEPLMSNVFSLDELIDLIDEKNKKKKRAYHDNNPSSQSHNPASALWGKLITHIKASTSSSTTTATSAALKHNKTFGVALAMAAQRDHDQVLLQQKQDDGGVTLRDYTPALAASFSDNALIPIFVKSCIMVILQSDMSIEGVFRKNGNIRQLRTLSESIDQLQPAANSMASIEELLANQNAIQLAALLKRYLRELPEPLLTFSLYKLFVQCGRIVEDQGQKKKVLHLACCLLPKPNRDTVMMLFCCLKWVSTFSDTNKMDIPNLARVIAPSVLFDRPSQTSSTSIVVAASAAVDLRQGAQEEINVIETLIREVDDLSIILCTPLPAIAYGNAESTIKERKQ